MVVSDSLCIGEFQKKIAITRNVFLSLEIYLSREKCVSKETDSALFCLSNLSPLDIRHCIFTWAFIVRFDWPSKAIFHFPKIISLRIQKNPLCHSLRSRKAESQNLISKKITLSYGRVGTVTDGGWGIVNSALPNPSSALPGTFSFGEKDQHGL